VVNVIPLLALASMPEMVLVVLVLVLPDRDMMLMLLLMLLLLVDDGENASAMVAVVSKIHVDFAMYIIGIVVAS
jgi:hypothetical protein